MGTVQAVSSALNTAALAPAVGSALGSLQAVSSALLQPLSILFQCWGSMEQNDTDSLRGPRVFIPFKKDRLATFRTCSSCSKNRGSEKQGTTMGRPTHMQTWRCGQKAAGVVVAMRNFFMSASMLLGGGGLSRLASSAPLEAALEELLCDRLPRVVR